MTAIVLDTEAMSLLARPVCLGRGDTDGQGFASLVGGVLHEASAGSVDMVDAHCVATAVENGGGVVIVSDIGDLERLGLEDPYWRCRAAVSLKSSALAISARRPRLALW